MLMSPHVWTVSLKRTGHDHKKLVAPRACKDESLLRNKCLMSFSLPNLVTCGCFVLRRTRGPPIALRFSPPSFCPLFLTITHRIFTPTHCCNPLKFRLAQVHWYIGCIFSPTFQSSSRISTSPLRQRAGRGDWQCSRCAQAQHQH